MQLRCLGLRLRYVIRVASTCRNRLHPEGAIPLSPILGGHLKISEIWLFELIQMAIGLVKYF